jgi:hypothetical protein
MSSSGEGKKVILEETTAKCKTYLYFSHPQKKYPPMIDIANIGPYNDSITMLRPRETFSDAITFLSVG